MSLSLLLLLLLLPICSSQASFYGTVMTYYPKNTYADGSVTVVLRYKLSFRTCQENASWTCGSGDCGNESSLVLNIVDQNSSGAVCQREGIMTRQAPSNAPFQLVLNGTSWIENIQNISGWNAVTRVELRNRSDTGRANTSPQTTILPDLRVPSNCQRDFSLLAFDPDGDEVRCRFGDITIPSCTLSFIPVGNSFERVYVQQLVMEDFPRQNISLTQTGGSQSIITPNEAISQIPVQFAFALDPSVPSCTEGLYLPKFLPPTPANRAELYTSVNHTLEINIRAEAKVSMISELLLSGPYNINQTTSGTGRFILRWTPSQREDGENHPICFVVQAVLGSTKYHSELRCLTVSVGNEPSSNATATPETPTTSPATTTETTAASNQIVVGLRVRVSSLSPLTDNIRKTVIQQLKDELERQGTPLNFTLSFVGSVTGRYNPQRPAAST
ncbi:uncharacterized protein LOC116669493 isoform X4 [Etheostoma spectabile]|uniref:uncharacterized protein LOC116669493 isoform X4 n=1 Tax=Etheostoma spectabile TaxID=54343 RepID=UPI0013AEA674|nr:uncharacterized protein LOC116669493 isoform X4 [Etheostoma spectabile]